MNILQITNTACSDTNQATGVNRVVTQLSDYWSRIHQDNCFHAYFEKGEITPLFKDSFCLKRAFTDQEFETFLLKNKINVIIFNYAATQMLDIQNNIYNIAHKNNIKMVYCHHFMPGSEGYSHGSKEEVLYSLISKKDILDKLKKWIITFTRPLSTKLIHIIMRKRYEIAYQNCDKLIVFTDAFIDRFQNIIKKQNKQKFEVIPNPLSFSEFIPKEKLITKNKEVIFVGRLVEAQKRVSAVLKIWKLIENNPLLTDWKLTIVGEGKDESFFHWLTNKYKLKRVSFEGRQDPKPYYERASIIMVTSACEAWSMVLVEAMPMGCCCLAFDSYDAIHDIIKDGENGKIIPDNNIKAYYHALSKLMLNDEKRTSMGSMAIESSKKFSMEIIGEKWRSLLSEMM